MEMDLVKMDLMKKKKKKGFTLIELIVVIAILGILAAIAVPRFAGFRARATAGVDTQYGALVGNAIVVAMSEGTLVGPIDITIGSTGAYAQTASATDLGTGTPLGATTDRRITDLVAVKPLADSTNTIRVQVSAEGVVTVTP